MYCPRCSQQQLPGEVRFCSQCGFQLAAVSNLLRTDGINYIQTQEKSPLIKRQELRKGGKLIFLSIFSVIPLFILAIIIDHPLPLVASLITFIVGLAQIFYYFLFGESLLPNKTQNKSFELNEKQRHLNYQSAQDFHSTSKLFDTAELAQPPSVTEPTASLFRNK